MGMNTVPTSGHPLSHPLLALALWLRQAGQLPPSLCSPTFCHSGRRHSHAHFLGLLSFKLSAAPAWLGRPGHLLGPGSLQDHWRGCPQQSAGKLQCGPASPWGLCSEETLATLFLSPADPASPHLTGTHGAWPLSCSRCFRPEAPGPGDQALGPVLTQRPSWWSQDRLWLESSGTVTRANGLSFLICEMGTLGELG